MAAAATAVVLRLPVTPLDYHPRQQRQTGHHLRVTSSSSASSSGRPALLFSTAKPGRRQLHPVQWAGAEPRGWCQCCAGSRHWDVAFALVQDEEVEDRDKDEAEEEEEEEEDRRSPAVKAAVSMLKFYKGVSEQKRVYAGLISPLLPPSCRYIPTCSEYAMQARAYTKYGVAKGTVLTAWRLMRCNPFGGSGYDPPRWFGEPPPHIL
eukprot:jgi/Chlat1/1311/Chrsp118S01720